MVKNRKYVLKRVGLELLFPILAIINILYYFIISKTIDSYNGTIMILIVFSFHLIFQSILGYWPKLTIDALFFNKKTERFKLVAHRKKPLDYDREDRREDFLNGRRKVDRLYAVRLSDNKEVAFPVTDVFGWEMYDIVEIKYYRLSKIILSCKLIEKHEQATEAISKDILE